MIQSLHHSSQETKEAHHRRYFFGEGEVDEIKTVQQSHDGGPSDADHCRRKIPFLNFLVYTATAYASPMDVAPESYKPNLPNTDPQPDVDSYVPNLLQIFRSTFRQNLAGGDSLNTGVHSAA